MALPPSFSFPPILQFLNLYLLSKQCALRRVCVVWCAASF
nr:MAG TPA: hypothetical protein [Caudoviricetes sp.]DAY52302.1 MAG TPA: hypothetical protein [Caudoviricetes sp.]